MDASRIIDQIAEQGAQQIPTQQITAMSGAISAQLGQMVAVLKQMSAVGTDSADLRSSVKYLEGAAILLGRVFQRNIQRESVNEEKPGITKILMMVGQCALALWALYKSLKDSGEWDNIAGLIKQMLDALDGVEHKVITRGYAK